MGAMRAALLLALLCVATSQAERDLLAHKASGGTSIHAVAITGSGYYSSNGNGTWASLTNGAYQRQAACYSSRTAALGPLTTYFVRGGSSITDVHFPSRLVGIAVGAGCSSFAAYTDQYGQYFAAPATTPNTFIPSILTTFDMGATWQYATGFGTKPKSFAQTLQLASNVMLGSTLPATSVSYPPPDLTSVYCATRTLCFAAGGYFGSEASLPAFNAATNPHPSSLYVDGKTNAFTSAAGAADGTIKAGIMPVGGAVLVSTNGGTFWNYVTLPYALPATGTTPPQPIPGLMDIASDASGRHVYAVGAPFFKNDYVWPGTVNAQAGGAAQAEPSSAGPGLANAQWGLTAQGLPVQSINTPAATGTIIYSGSYGASNSWMLQSAPFIPNHWYSLSAVTVLRGSVAIAVGGSPFGLSNNAFNNSIAGVVTAGLGVTLPTTTFTIAQAAPLRPSGVVLMTMNGGFRWMSQNLPGWSYWSTVYRGTNGGSFVYDTVLQGDGMLPALNDVACYQSSNAATGASSYSCFAVGDWGYMVQSTIPYNSLSTGVIASAAPTWNFVNVTQVAKQTGYLDFYGIAWDNNVVGYAYGNSFIVSTHDGGNTWVSETPNGIVTSASLSSYVVGLATVPTTY